MLNPGTKLFQSTFLPWYYLDRRHFQLQACYLREKRMLKNGFLTIGRAITECKLIQNNKKIVTLYYPEISIKIMKALLITLSFLSLAVLSFGQAPKDETESDSLMITIFMKHHQDKNIEELKEIRNKNGFLKDFPPPSAKVVNWYVMMGIGQVVTVKIPASELRNLNIAVEKSVWGAFSTEFYPTYDLHPHILEEKKKLKSPHEE